MSRKHAPDAVLVVDDEPFIRMAAADIVEDAGWVALEAANAEEALKVIAQNPEVKVLFTDVTMPGTIDGVRLAECVHREHPQIELVLTSGERHLSENMLPDEGTFLRKPYGRDELVRTLKEKLC